MDRNKLETLIERELHRFFSVVTEHVVDFVHVYVLRNKLDLDRPTLLKTLEIVRVAMTDGFQTKIMGFSEGIKKALDLYTEEQHHVSPKSKK